MGTQSGTTLNLSDGFGSYARWNRPVAQVAAVEAKPVAMARDGYTPQRVAQAPRVGYAHLNTQATRGRLV